jgi:DNA-binding SARP family transcriptional activator
MALSLRLLGGLSVEGDSGPGSGPAVQRHRLALLALLARSRSLSRDKLIAFLWPERDTEHARGLLNQAVHVLRRTFGSEALLSTGDELRIDPRLIPCDAIEFETAVAANELERAAGLYGGPFLDGFFLNDAAEFEQWVARERDLLATQYARVLDCLAEQASADHATQREVEWRKARVAFDPHDSGAVIRLMLALEASGNRAEALLQADAHRTLLREELGLEAAPEVEAVASRLRSAPAVSDLPSRQAAGGGPPWIADQVPQTTPGPTEVLTPTSRLRRPGVLAAAGLATGLLLTAIIMRAGSDNARHLSAVTPAAVDEITRAVSRELERRARGDTGNRQPQTRTHSIPAYELYLRGSDPAVLRSDTAAMRGLEYFRKAIALDSSYPAAWAGLARLTMRVGSRDTTATRSGYLGRAETAALRAIRLDPSLSEAHATLGLVRMAQADLTGAELHLRHAIDLDPRTAPYREYLVRLYLWEGRATEALAEAQRARELNPLSPTATAEMARALLANRRCEEALPHLEKLAELEPPLARVPGILAQCYAQQGRLAEAIDVIRTGHDLESPNTAGLLGYLLGRAGREAEARQMLLRLQAAANRGVAANCAIALILLGLADLDRAVPFLDRAVDEGSLSAITEYAPLPAILLDSLRADPRIARVRERLGLQNR